MLIRKFANVPPGSFKRNIADLWPVLARCRELTQTDPERYMGEWIKLAVALYQVPNTPETFTNLYDATVHFIKQTKI